MLKKIAALAVSLCAAGAVHADVGPIYVSYPGYCNIKQVYLDNAGSLYGREVGCAAITGAPMMGFVQPNGSFVFSAQDGTGNACIHTYNTNGSMYASCSTGVATFYHTPFPYFVTAGRPKLIVPKGEKALPALPF